MPRFQLVYKLFVPRFLGINVIWLILGLTSYQQLRSYGDVDQLANCHSAPLRYLVPLPCMERFNGIPMEIFCLMKTGEAWDQNDPWFKRLRIVYIYISQLIRSARVCNYMYVTGLA